MYAVIRRRASSDTGAEAVPHSLKKHSFSLSSNPTHDSLSALIPSYNDRAHHVYSYVYEQSSAYVPAEFENLKDFLEGDYHPHRFGAFDFTHISELKDHIGSSHDQVKAARKTLHRILSGLSKRSDIKVAVVTIPSEHHHKEHSEHDKRQPPSQSPLPPPLPRPAEPIDSISSCFSSAETCGNTTSSCSGHGECVQATKAGKTCFVCACSATKDKKGRKEQWAGLACERKDVSG